MGCALNATRIAEILKDYDSKQSMLSPRENGKVFAGNFFIEIFNSVSLRESDMAKRHAPISLQLMFDK